jgi:hypothetical protein
MRQRVCVAGGIIDLHKLQIIPAPGGAQGQSSHAAKAVDTYFDGHRRRSSIGIGGELSLQKV